MSRGEKGKGSKAMQSRYLKSVVPCLVLCTLISAIRAKEEAERVSEAERCPLTALAQEAPFIRSERDYPAPVPDEVISILKQKKERGETDHFCLLVEYGLRVHWRYLTHTRLSRELPLESDMMLAELVRIAKIPQYTTAYEGGWLNRQFDGNFEGTGWSSYQIYVWVKENPITIYSDEKAFPNLKRIGDLLETIEKSDLNGLGGRDVCHYGCI